MSAKHDFLKHKDDAIRQYEGARHLLNVTYRTVKDPKLLLGVMNNLTNSFEHAVDAILAYEKLLMLVPTYSQHWQSKFNLFRYKCVRRNKIPIKHVNNYIDMKETLLLHKRSPMAFQRGNRLVICNNDYQLKTLSLKDLKNYLDNAKEFLSVMERIIRKR